jgi:glycosyltransferase involved in cell wall biosynthesis
MGLGDQAAGLERPFVSIVTPTLNQARYIQQTIQSIRAQTYTNVEHIVIDGGSTDETLDILREHEHSYRMRWVSEPDEGMYDAINKGLRMARGEILAYLNSDDLYFPWTVDVVVSAFRGDKGAGLVYGDALRLDDSVGSVAPWFQPPFNWTDMIAVGSLVQPTVFLRRRLLDTVGTFDASLRYVGDLDYWLRVGDVESIVRIDEMLAVDRVHPEAASVVARVDMEAEDRAIRRRHRRPSKGRIALAIIRTWLWRRRLWLRFVASSRRRGNDRPWDRLLDAGGAGVPTSAAVLGLLPLLGSRFRKAIIWTVDPVALASGQAGTQASSESR